MIRQSFARIFLVILVFRTIENLCKFVAWGGYAYYFHSTLYEILVAMVIFFFVYIFNERQRREELENRLVGMEGRLLSLQFRYEELRLHQQHSSEQIKKALEQVEADDLPQIKNEN